MGKLPHYCADSRCHFITATTYRRARVFADRNNATVLWKVLRNQRTRGRLHLLGFVIMPDHLHLLLMPRGVEVGFIMQEIKKGSARLINRLANRRGKVWQDEYYDYVVRSDVDLQEKTRYVHQNPVKKGLVDSEEDYPFSSANPEFESFLGVEGD